jgi:hypothetical protein
MSASPAPSWKTARGDEWWWTGTPTLVGSLYEAISVFAIDNPFGGTPQQLRAVLQATAGQFPEMQIHCMYDERTTCILDELQREGLLRWTDVGNPYSRYASIELVKPTCVAKAAAGEQDLPSPGASRPGLGGVAALAVGILFLIRGALVLLRGAIEPYGYSRPDDLFFGTVGFPIGLICVAVAVHLRRTRRRNAGSNPPRRLKGT